MRKFFKDNIWLFAIVAAILVIQGILAITGRTKLPK